MTVGSGSDIALGSLVTTKGEKPRARILKALQAASKHQSGCVKPPFFIINTVDGLITELKP